jgi:hypothetical protein
VAYRETEGERREGERLRGREGERERYRNRERERHTHKKKHVRSA